MSNFEASNKKEVSESAFEFLLAELYAFPPSSLGTSDETPERAGKLDSMGYDVGYRYAERILSMQKLIGPEPLDVIKFICKEFWEEVFRKKVCLCSNRPYAIYILT